MRLMLTQIHSFMSQTTNFCTNFKFLASTSCHFSIFSRMERRHILKHDQPCHSPGATSSCENIELQILTKHDIDFTLFSMSMTLIETNILPHSHMEYLNGTELPTTVNNSRKVTMLWARMLASCPRAKNFTLYWNSNSAYWFCGAQIDSERLKSFRFEWSMVVVKRVRREWNLFQTFQWLEIIRMSSRLARSRRLHNSFEISCKHNYK